jgi:choline dehydrogenase-like flavoprotein
LEKGKDLPEDGSTLDPAQVIAGRFNSKEKWNDACRGCTFQPEEHFNPGGKTRWYGAALLRFDRHEFEAEPRCGLLPWPISLDELQPYYADAEALLDVRQFDDEPDLMRMRPALAAAGWQGQPLPLGLSAGIVVHPYEQTHYDGYAIPGGLKADARHRLLDRIRGRDNFQFEMAAPVERLLATPGNPRRIAGVRCIDGREFHAGTVLLGAGAMHSPRLLQRYLAVTGLHAQLPSANIVGRHFKRHILTAVIGFGLKAKTDRICKTSLFVHEQFPHSSVQPLGGWADRETVRFLLPGWLPRWLREFVALRAYGFFLQTEDASHPDNRVAAEGDDGLPTLDYDLSRMPELVAEHRGMVSAFRRAFVRARFINFKQTIGIQGTAHCGGTLSAGSDATQSVVDGNGKVHGMDNLYVVDGSVLPRLSRMNPALTIFAWALKVADALC